MVTTRRQQQQSPTTKERKAWELILNSLKRMLRKQVSQLQIVIQERDLLSHRLQSHYDTWSSDVILFQHQHSQLRRQLELTRLANAVEFAKAQLSICSNHRDAFNYKLKLEHAQSELDDFKAWFDILSHRCSDTKDISLDTLYEILNDKVGKDGSLKEPSAQCYKMLEKEVATLKREFEKLSVKNSSEVSSLQAEIKFAWNQYNEMEGKYANQLRAKHDEVNQANEKIRQLLDRLEQLQLTNSEKDDTVVTLRANISKLEAEKRQKDEEISRYLKESEPWKSKGFSGLPSLKRCSGETSSSGSKCGKNSRNRESSDCEKESTSGQLEATIATLRARVNNLEAEANHKNGEIATLSKELNLLRSKSVGNTPALGRFTSEPSSSSLRGRGNGGTRRTIVSKGEASSAHLVSEKGVRRSKRKHDGVIILEDTPVATPRLFTSEFKIPKLKSQSPHGR